MGHSESSAKREMHSITGLPKEGRKISNKQLNPMPKRLEKQQQIKPRERRRKEITKIKTEISDIETNK